MKQKLRRAKHRFERHAHNFFKRSALAERRFRQTHKSFRFTFLERSAECQRPQVLDDFFEVLARCLCEFNFEMLTLTVRLALFELHTMQDPASPLRWPMLFKGAFDLQPFDGDPFTLVVFRTFGGEHIPAVWLPVVISWGWIKVVFGSEVAGRLDGSRFSGRQVERRYQLCAPLPIAAAVQTECHRRSRLIRVNFRRNPIQAGVLRTVSHVV